MACRGKEADPLNLSNSTQKETLMKLCHWNYYKEGCISFAPL